MVGRAPLLVLDDVVVVRTEQWTLADYPLNERRKVEIGATAGLLKGVI